jgi:hypothetical protein
MLSEALGLLHAFSASLIRCVCCCCSLPPPPGSLPSDLGGVSGLTLLDVSGNRLTGPMMQGEGGLNRTQGIVLHCTTVGVQLA